MKRYLSPVLAALMILSLSACSDGRAADILEKNEETGAERAEEVQADAPRETEAEKTFDASAYDYADADLGIFCDLGRGWTKEDDEDLQKLNEEIREDLQEQADEIGTFAHSIEYKLIARQSKKGIIGYVKSYVESMRIPMGFLRGIAALGTDDVRDFNYVSVYVEDLASISGIALTEEYYISVCMGEDDSILEALGIENGTVEHTEMEIAGQTHTALAISGTIDGEAYYQLRIFCKPRDLYRYITIFMAESFGENTTDDIIQDMVCAIE